MFEHVVDRDPESLWRDAGGPACTGGRIINRHRMQWPHLAVVITDMAGRDEIEMDLGATRLRLSVSLEHSGKGHPMVIREARNPRESLEPVVALAAHEAAQLNLDHVSFYRHMMVYLSDAAVAAFVQDETCRQDLLAGRLASNDPRLLRVLRLIAEECMSEPAMARLYAESLTSALFAALTCRRDTARSRGGLAPWQLRRVTAFMHQHRGGDLSLDALAAHVQLSRSYFCRAFKLTTGQTPHQWQLSARIERAKELMLTSRLPLAQIALDTGFSDQAHFTRVFRKLASQSPRQWLKLRQA